MSYTLLTIIANASLGRIPAGSNVAFPQWTGPDHTIVPVLSILYASLSCSLLAAFITVLNKQWLNRYSRVEMRGTVVDRSRRRQRKMEGMTNWHFDLMMDCAPLLLQASLLLLGCALSYYLFPINNTIAGVVLGTTSLGVVFYLFITLAGTLSSNCPYQTPGSFLLRSVIRYDGEYGRFRRRSRQWLGRAFSFSRREQQRTNPGGPYPLTGLDTSDEKGSGDHIELLMAGQPDQQPPLFNKETNWRGYVLDSDCIAWMFDMSMDVNATLAVIPEVIWHAGIRTTPLERLYDAFIECFDRSSGRPTVIPKLKDKAYLSAKALLHVAIQRKCIGGELDGPAFISISARHPAVGWKRYEGDSDLESTLGIIDRVFGDFEEMHWNTFSLSVPHHSWMGHILLCRAWDVLRRGEALPGDVKEFVLHSLQLEPAPPAPIVADCLFIIGLVIGIKMHVDDLLVTDKR